MQVHNKVVPLKDPVEFQFACDECPARLKTRSGLRKHRMHHTKQRTFRLTCKICKKLCRTVNHLNTHMFGHSGNYPFVCTICQKGFALRRDLDNHSRIHKPSAHGIMEIGVRYEEVGETEALANEEDITSIPLFSDVIKIIQPPRVKVESIFPPQKASIKHH